jgi:hypothetical protein
LSLKNSVETSRIEQSQPKKVLQRTRGRGRPTCSHIGMIDCLLSAFHGAWGNGNERRKL